MLSLTPFLALLSEIEDPRRAEGKLYRLPHVVLFAILAMVSGANSYRAIHSFIDVHLARLRDFFSLPWRRAPAYSTIRFILQQLDTASVEQVFRRHAAILHAQAGDAGQRHVAIDGKALRHSFDHFQDRKAAHILSAFASDVARAGASRLRREVERNPSGAGSARRTRPRRRCHHRRCHALSKKHSNWPPRPMPS
jgi:hypothetical protein